MPLPLVSLTTKSAAAPLLREKSTPNARFCPVTPTHEPLVTAQPPPSGAKAAGYYSTENSPPIEPVAQDLSPLAPQR